MVGDERAFAEEWIGAQGVAVRLQSIDRGFKTVQAELTSTNVPAMAIFKAERQNRREAD